MSSASTGAHSGQKDVTFSLELERPGGDKEEEEEDMVEEAVAVKEKHNRNPSCSSVYSTENDDDDDEDGEDDKDVVLLGPQIPLKEQLELDKDDESLRRWKEQLLGSVDFSAVGENAEPEVRIVSLSIMSAGRPDLVLPIPLVPNAKGYAFALKDGCRYHLKFTFTVSNNIVSGLKYTNTVWKTGVKVDGTKVMLGTFSPRQEPYIYELEEESTPSGIFARGSYSARSKFVDDDGKCYLDISYHFEIRKEWPTSS